MSLSRTAASLRDEIVRDVAVPKILVAPTRTQGRQILESICLDGQSWANVRVETLDSLAFRLAAGQAAVMKRRWADSLDRRLVVEDILSRRAADDASYFSDLTPGSGLVTTLLNAISDLRMSGLDPAAIPPGRFESRDKGNEIRTCLELYITMLGERGLCDRADAFRLAIEAASRMGRRDAGEVYLIAPGLELYGLSRKFFDVFLRDRSRSLAADAAAGAVCPPHCIHHQAGPPATALGCIHSPGEWKGGRERPDAADIDLYHAAGVTNELREVMRRVTAEGLRFDEVEIVASDTAVYGAALVDLCAKLDCSCTLADGLPAGRSRPGRVTRALLDWIESGYAAEPVRRLILSGDIVLPAAEGARPAETLAAHIFRDLKIGWGLERYLRIIDGRIRASRAAIEETGDGESDPEGARMRLAALLSLRGLAEDLMADAPACGPENHVGPAFLSRYIRQFLAKRLAIARGTAGPSDRSSDRQIYELLDKRLHKLACADTRSLPVKEAAGRVRACLDELQIERSGPRPGCIHLSHFKHGGRSGRRRTFVVGMDEARFPGSGSQNPVLLDGERAGISGSLVTAEDAVRAGSFAMGAMLAGLRGRVTLSFCSWDLAENRSVAPSPLMLQAHRLIAGDPAADYAALKKQLGQPVSAVPGEGGELDETDSWLSAMHGNGMIRDAAGLLDSHFPALHRGLEAAAARESDRATRFDGMVEADDSRDPRRNRGAATSCSRIELLASCPLAYFFRYVLEIRRPEDREYDPTRWLDALQRGSLLHDVYREYIQELIDGDERPSERTERRLEQILTDRLDRMESEFPPPSRIVRDHEVRDLYRSIGIFNRMEMDDTEGTPLLLEFGFGVGGGKVGPLPVTLPSGLSFHLAGRIDRVDRIGKNAFRVLDYKTGGSGRYDGRWYFLRGRRVQHALYSIAAEAVLKELGISARPEVSKAGYVFPTFRGEGRRVTRPQNRRSELLVLLDRLFDVMRAGSFLAAEDGGFCGICDYYEDVCGDAAAKRAKEKLKKDPQAVLRTIAEISNYE